MKSVELYGIRNDAYASGYDTSEVTVLAATFSTKEASEAYVKASEVPFNERTVKRLPFHPASVLGAYTSFEIEVLNEPSIPHDPQVNW